MSVNIQPTFIKIEKSIFDGISINSVNAREIHEYLGVKKAFYKYSFGSFSTWSWHSLLNCIYKRLDEIRPRPTNLNFTKKSKLYILKTVGNKGYL